MSHNSSSGQTTHVLIADDDPTSLKFFVRFLELNGYRATPVRDGQQAQDRVRQGDIDIVLSDIGMPGLNGIQLLNAIGATEYDPPVILITGNPQLETAVQAVNGRAVAYLHKPVDSGPLLEAVKKAENVARLAKVRRDLMSLVPPTATQAAGSPKGHAEFINAQKTLWMAFQPIVSISRGKPYAYEALVRSEEETLRSPTALLQAAEAQGKLPDLGRQIRDSVASMCARIPEDVNVFVNLLPQDLLDDNMYSPASELGRHAHRVVLEITERESLGTVTELDQRLGKLRQMGYRLALDDLGAGYSGLTSFIELKPDVVKLDMALIRNIERSADQRLLVASIVKMLSEFKALVVAEGVETQEEYETLRPMGIDLIQGYLFGKPQRDPTSGDLPAVLRPRNP